jgi:hypothetical protein
MIFVSFNSYTTGVTCEASTAFPSGAPENIAGFSGFALIEIYNIGLLTVNIEFI